jgi:nucleoside-diphosphate-sugar epimerase
MQVFVAGGSGAIARELVPKLVAAGHETPATARSSVGTASALQSQGAAVGSRGWS